MIAKVWIVLGWGSHGDAVTEPEKTSGTAGYSTPHIQREHPSMAHTHTLGRKMETTLYFITFM